MRRGVTHFTLIECDRCHAGSPPSPEGVFGHSEPPGWVSFTVERCAFDLCPSCVTQPVLVGELLERARAPHAGWPARSS